MADPLKENVTPPVRRKIVDDTVRRVTETVEHIYTDLDRAGFDRGEAKEAVRDGLDKVWQNEKNR